MPELSGARVALLEARMAGELSELVRRNGGDPFCAPAVEEVPLSCADDVRRFISTLANGHLPIVVFLTGAGAAALFREAEALGRQPELVEALKRAVTVCRGPKPSGVLARLGVPVDVRVPEPYTTPDVMRALDPLELDETGVAIVHYGERNDALADALRARGAWLEELSLYEWRLPRDLAPLRSLVKAVIGGRFDAVAFTSQVQVRHLVLVAGDLDLLPELVRALNERTVVAAVGPTCAAALRIHGIVPRVVPVNPKMGSMVAALAVHLGGRRAAPAPGAVEGFPR